MDFNCEFFISMYSNEITVHGLQVTVLVGNEPAKKVIRIVIQINNYLM